MRSGRGTNNEGRGEKMNNGFDVLGKGKVRKDAVEKVTGNAK